MKLLLFAILILFLILASIFIYTWYRLHIKVNIRAESPKYTLPAGWKAETRYVSNRDGQKIAYWYFPKDTARAVVILIHGYSNPGGKAQMLDHAKYLHDAGYSTVLLDLRSFGESDGSKITLGINEWKDVDAVFDDIKSKSENKDKKIGFLGISMGAATAIVTAGETQKGDFIIASVPYSNFHSLFHTQIKAAGLPPQIIYPFMRFSAQIEFGKDYEKYTPTNAIKDINVPILLISAQKDEELNPQDARDLYDLASEPKQYWDVDGGHDVFGQRPKEFKEKVLKFIETNIN